MGVAAYAASLILPPTSPLPPEGQARLTAALQERDLGSLAGARHLPPETVAHLWHEALAPFWRTRAATRRRAGPSRRPSRRSSAGPRRAPRSGGRRRTWAAAKGFEGVALALVAASAASNFAARSSGHRRDDLVKNYRADAH